jgi:hypothetical protein
MKFSRWVFLIAGLYGIIVLVPMFFSETNIGVSFPPAITHPEYFYGFLGITLTWQFLFLLIAFNPLRYKPVMLLAIIEKLIYGLTIIYLFEQGRLAAMMLSAGVIDLLLGCLFFIAFFKTREKKTVLANISEKENLEQSKTTKDVGEKN